MDHNYEIKALKDHLDATAGAQLAMFGALSVLLGSYKGNPLAIASLTTGLERTHASLLSSNSSDAKIQAFDQTRETILELLL